MAHEEKLPSLPWDVTEEILSRTPPKSLVRFRAVSKQWNDLLNDKTFISKYKQTFHFVLKTKSKIYSVSINPEIVVQELTLGSESEIPKNLFDCNGFLICEMNKGAVVWSPSLNQTRWLQPEVNQPRLQFTGIGYGKDKESGYKTLIYGYPKESNPTKACYKIHDFASNTLKDHKYASSSSSSSVAKKKGILLTSNGVSLNGSLYWVVQYVSDPVLVLFYFDFLEESFLHCDLPFEKKHNRDALVLRAFGEDRLSLLKQCHLSKKVEIWVTKNKVLKGEYVKNVEWKKFMEVSNPNFPDLVQTGSKSQPSYFIEDKKLVVCSCDETGQAWIYVAVDNKLISQIRIDSIVDPWPVHCTYFTSLISVPDQVQRGDEKMQI